MLWFTGVHVPNYFVAREQLLGNQRRLQEVNVSSQEIVQHVTPRKNQK